MRRVFKHTAGYKSNSMSNYTEQYAELRKAAIADITNYVRTNGDVTVKNLNRNYRTTISLNFDGLWFGQLKQYEIGSYDLFACADMINQLWHTYRR